MASPLNSPIRQKTFSFTFGRIVAFVLKAQMQQMFQVQNSLSVLGRILFVAVVLLYAVGLGMALLFAKRFQASTETLLWGINTGLAVLTFIKSYFPTYSTTSQPIASFYPMSRIQKAFMGIALDALSLFPLGMMTFYGVMFAIAFTVLTGFQIISSLLFFLSAVLLDRALRLVLEYNLRKRIVWGIVAITLIVCLFAVSILPLPFANGLFVKELLASSHYITLPVLFTLAIFVQIALAYEAILPQTERIGRTTSISLPSSNAGVSSVSLTALKAFFGSKHIYMLFGMAVLLKIVLLFGFVVNMLKHEQISSIRQYLLLSVYTAPIAWFTYFLNNSFGMNWQVWQSYMQSGTRRNALLLYCWYASVPIMLDAAMVFGTLVPLGLVNTRLVVNWCAALLTFSAWGFIVATLMPLKVENLTSSVWMSLRSVSSKGGIVGVLVGLAIISLFSAIHVLLPLIVPAIVIIGAVYMLTQYPRLKHKTYSRIHR